MVTQRVAVRYRPSLKCQFGVPDLARLAANDLLAPEPCRQVFELMNRHALRVKTGGLLERIRDDARISVGCKSRLECRKYRDHRQCQNGRPHEFPEPAAIKLEPWRWERPEPSAHVANPGNGRDGSHGWSRAERAAGMGADGQVVGSEAADLTHAVAPRASRSIWPVYGCWMVRSGRPSSVTRSTCCSWSPTGCYTISVSTRGWSQRRRCTAGGNPCQCGRTSGLMDIHWDII